MRYRTEPRLAGGHHWHVVNNNSSANYGEPKMNSNTMKRTAAMVVSGVAMSIFLVAAVAADVEQQSKATDLAAGDSGLGGAHDFQWMCQQYLEIMSTSAS